jgi:probable selenium-dependent hydroxylase accessory protein YqeC
MGLAELVLAVRSPSSHGGSIVAFVGAGGKTSGLYALAGELSDRGVRVLVTTTTMMYDPAREGGRGLDGVEVLAPLAPDADRASASAVESLERALARIRARAAAGRVLMVVSGTLAAEGKIRGIGHDIPERLAPAFDWLLVEADGSRRLPVKAPGPTEPAMPSRADLVLGFVGLDCLGRPIAAETVHRHELFARLVGAAPGEAITAAHLATLATARDGLFKAAPPSARRIVVLNKADLLPAGRLGAVLDAFDGASAQGIDLVAACCVAARSGRVVALRRVVPRPNVPMVEWRR